MEKTVRKNSSTIPMILMVIILLSVFLRIVLLDKVPNGLFSDEARFGYEAYSLIETGKDMTNKSFPLVFDAYEDPSSVTEGMFTYICIPFIHIFGMNEFGVRIASAVLGVLTVFFIFLLVKEMFNEKTALLAALLLSISSWHVQYSRISFEVIALPCFVVIGLYFFYKAINENPKWLIYSAVLFALSMYSYSVSKLFIPLLLMAIFFVYREYIIKNKKVVIKALIFFVIILIPLINLALFDSGDTAARFDRISIFTKGHGIFDYTIMFVKNMITYYSPGFLFFKGDPLIRHSIRGFGQMHIFHLPFILIGIYMCIRKNKLKNKLLLAWLLMFPVAGSLTFSEGGHASRVIAGLPLLIILSAYGLYSSWSYIRNNRRKLAGVFIVLVALIITSNSVIYFYNYFVKYPEYSGPDWLYGYREAVNYIEKVKDTYRNVYIYDKPDRKTEYVNILFYNKYAPEKFQRDKFRGSKYRFIRMNADNLLKFYQSDEKNDLFLVRAYDLKDIKPEHIVYYPNGMIAYKLIKSGTGETFNEEIAEYKEILKKNVDVPLAHFKLGFYYHTNNMPDKALVEYKKAIELKRNFSKAYFNIGVIYQNLGRHEEAIDEYKKAINENPGYAEAYNNLIALCNALGNKDEEFKYTELLLKKKPYSFEAHFNAAVEYYNRGKIDKAIKEYKYALKLEPDFHRTHMYLGYAYNKKGLHDKTREEYIKAQKIVKRKLTTNPSEELNSDYQEICRFLKR